MDYPFVYKCTYILINVRCVAHKYNVCLEKSLTNIDTVFNAQKRSYKLSSFLQTTSTTRASSFGGQGYPKQTRYLRGGLEPLEKEIHEILGSKREDRFSNPFFELVQNTCQVRFLYLFRYGNICKGPRTLRKFPQKCQKIAGCWGRAVYVRKLQSPRHLAHPLRNNQV